MAEDQKSGSIAGQARLSLVKAIVERVGGTALLESELGVGTSLVIHLPCAVSSSISSPPPPPPGGS